MARTKTNSAGVKPAASNSIASIKYPAKRKNIPPAGLEAQGRIQEAPKLRFEYNPHLPPVLRSATEAADADKLPELLQLSRKRALTDEEARALAAALRRQEPWLEWSGKREKPWFEVEPVALHIHERVSTQAILRVLAREDIQRDLFADPQQAYAQAVQFYQHEVDWSNRMILGDSLQVMASLARREDLAGRVQMIYIDPPYGISFRSNFQPLINHRDVKDKEQDLTREPETVRAYRDTWTLGVHSYLAYLRDRLAMTRELLADTGSIFVQISDENLHRLRCVMDEVFGPQNFASLITFATTGGFETKTLSRSGDYLLWYAKDIQKVKYRQLFRKKSPENLKSGDYRNVLTSAGEIRTIEPEEDWDKLPEGSRLFRFDNITSQDSPKEPTPFEFNGRVFEPRPGRHWSAQWPDGMNRMKNANRLIARDNSLASLRFFEDYPVFEINNSWSDTSIAGTKEGKLYVVQTNTKVVERCLLMTTDPGDLVLDPTCGSGTTALVAEQWGRRWITCDTSRVALALARQRLMTARFSYYKLRPLSADDLQRNPQGTWLTDPTAAISGKCTLKCNIVPHITLKSIARNTSLDPIFAKHDSILASRLKDLNTALKTATAEVRQKLSAKLAEKQKHEGKRSITEADRRRWELPKASWQEWQVPFDTDPDWPKPLRDALTIYRSVWQDKMKEVNACIEANAEPEEIVDDPDPVPNIIRVAGPFTMEGVIAVEDGPESPIGGAPGQLETFGGELSDGASADLTVANAEAHLDKILRLLKASGVDFAANKNQKFTRLNSITGASLIHAEGEWANGDKKERRVAVSIGPEIGNVTTYQVEEAVRAANRRGYDDLIFAGFGFDAAAQDSIEQATHPNLRVHMALIRPDVAMGDLLKTQPGSQLFTVFSAPRVSQPDKQSDGQYVIEVEGMDVYDPVSNTLFPTDKERIAAWFLDTDYDARTFCICQAFFPDKTKWDKLARALGDRGVVAEEAFAALSGLRSLPFPRPSALKKGQKWQVAVKVIDPRGNEGLRVVTMP
jgi:adenine-specific DNA-methyltransferase